MTSTLNTSTYWTLKNSSRIMKKNMYAGILNISLVYHKLLLVVNPVYNIPAARLHSLYLIRLFTKHQKAMSYLVQ